MFDIEKSIHLMHKIFVIIILIFSSGLIFSQTQFKGASNVLSLASKGGQSPPGPKNIILMIGDGMGITQISAGMYMNDNQLNLEKFPDPKAILWIPVFPYTLFLLSNQNKNAIY